jgi:hypothetical protein
MNRYSENIAELLLLGRTELDDFYAARSSLEDGLARLTTLVEDEIEFVRTAAERAAETEELARVNKMRELFENIDLRSGSSKSMQARLRSRAIPRVSPSWSSGCRSRSRTGGRRSRRSILPKRCKPNPPCPQHSGESMVLHISP